MSIKQIYAGLDMNVNIRDALLSEFNPDCGILLCYFSHILRSFSCQASRQKKHKIIFDHPDIFCKSFKNSSFYLISEIQLL